MKKVLLALVMAVSVISAKAQTTMNVRAGYGYNTDAEGFTGAFQVNMPLKMGSKWTFSPSLQVDMGFDCDCDRGSQNILLPLYLGHKMKLGNSLFFPKIGPAVGYDIYSDERAFNFGPSVELAFEYKHFVAAINAYSSVIEVARDYYYGTSETAETNIYTASLTIGYKF